jgi:hypothetical protein
MFLSEGVLKSLKKRFAQSSIRTINTNMKRLFKDGLGSNKFVKARLVDDFTKISNFMKGLKPSVQKSMAHNVRAIIGKDHEGYNDLVRLFNAKDKIVRKLPVTDKGIVARARRSLMKRGTQRGKRINKFS